MVTASRLPSVLPHRGMKTAIRSGYLHRLPAEAADRHEVMVKPMRPVELIDAVRHLIG